MRALSKTLTYTIFLLLSLIGLAAPVRCVSQVNIGALHIGAGITWVSSPDTYVVLDRMDLQYDAGPGLLNNVFRFTGQSTNSIRGDSRPLIYAIGVNKFDPGMVNLDQAVTIAGRINFEMGYLNLHGNGLFLLPDALFTNESNNNQLVGPFGGYVSIDADLHAGVTYNPGNLGAVITPTIDLGRVTISRSHDVQNFDSTRYSIQRWYNIAASAGVAIGATLRLNYLEDEVEPFNPDSLDMYQGLDESPWQDIGYTTRDGSQFYVEKQGLTSLGRFTLAMPSATSTTPPPPPPPIGASGPMMLAGAWSGDFAQLNWNITAEYLDQHFDVERKYATQSDFGPVATVPTKAPGGNSSTIEFYTYMDTTVRTAPDDVTYRIRRVGANGDAAYSNTITLKAKTDSTSEFIHSLYPTFTVGGQVYIEVGNMALDKISFIIVDARGAIVHKGELPYQSQWLPVPVLARGVYRLIIQAPGHKYHGTFIK